MPLEGQRRWLEVGEVSRVVDLERRSVKYQASVGIWSDFSGLPGGLSFSKVKEGGWRPERSQRYGSCKEIREISGFCRDLVRFFRTSKRLMPLEGQGRCFETSPNSNRLL